MGIWTLDMGPWHGYTHWLGPGNTHPGSTPVYPPTPGTPLHPYSCQRIVPVQPLLNANGMFVKTAVSGSPIYRQHVARVINQLHACNMPVSLTSVLPECAYFPNRTLFDEVS